MNFSPKESLKLFFGRNIGRNRGLAPKKIAKRLAISYKMVEVHLINIYNKASVHSLVQLIEYCRHAGIDKYIPLNFIRKGVQLID